MKILRTVKRNQNRLIHRDSFDMANVKCIISILLLFGGSGHLLGQVKASRGDNLFHGYAYKDAIVAYEKQMAKDSLSNQQYLRLADSYYQTKAYKKAIKIYERIYQEDTIMSSYRVNKMLQSFSKTDQADKIKIFLGKNRDKLKGELIENANFNYELQSKTEQKAVQIVNVSANSPQADFATSFYTDQKVLFTSGRPQKDKEYYRPSGEDYLDIFIARANQTGDLLNPNIFQGMPASSYHKATPYYASKTDVIYYILSNTENNKLLYDKHGKNALAVGMLGGDGKFQFLLRDLSTSFYYPYYYDKEEVLYFAANFEDGFGGSDLYYVRMNNGQIMSSPINLGPRVNTPGNEIAPYLFEGSLYFSSDIFYGYGGMDVYRTEVRDLDTYSIPVNLGSNFNSKFDDFGFILKRTAQQELQGYFSSNRPGGKGNDDIYAYHAKQIPGPKTLMVHGNVVNPRNDLGLPEAVVSIQDSIGVLIEKGLTNPAGYFRFELPIRNQLMVTIKKPGYSVWSASYNKANLDLLKSPLQVELLGLRDVVRSVEKQHIIKLNKFYFATGKSEITPDIAVELDKVVRVLNNFPKMQIQIQSHTDSKGNDRANKRLSQLRAETIEKYLLAKGVSPSRIAGAIGFGEERIVNNCSNGVYCLDFLHQQNRRTEFVILNYDQILEESP